MAKDTRIWEISEKTKLLELTKSKLDFEDRLEDWIEDDISIIDHNLIIVDRQFITDSGKKIDLLCIDSIGDLVIIELKRDKTPRDVTAQVLEYATWVKELSNERITKIANIYLGEKGPLEKAFKEKFVDELPDILNENHKMIIVASEMDDSTERIINYLSDSYGVAINTISFQYFKKDDGKEYLTRTFLIEPSEVDRKSITKRSSKRNPPISFDEWREIAKKNNVVDLFDNMCAELATIFDNRVTTQSTVTYRGFIEKKPLTILNIVPKDSNDQDGLKFYVYIERLADYLKVEKSTLENILPENIEEGKTWNVDSLAIFGYFKSLDEIKNFSQGLKSLQN